MAKKRTSRKRTRRRRPANFGHITPEDVRRAERKLSYTAQTIETLKRKGQTQRAVSLADELIGMEKMAQAVGLVCECKPILGSRQCFCETTGAKLKQKIKREMG